MTVNKISFGPTHLQRPYKFEFLERIAKLAGPNGTEPVFRECMICHRQALMDEPNKWFEKMDIQAIKSFSPKFKDVSIFPAISHGLCGTECEREYERKYMGGER